MKYYISYMDRQTVSPQLHERLLAMGETEHRFQTKKKISPRRRQWAALAACCALIVGIGVWKLAPAQSSGQFAAEADSLIPGAKDTYGPGELPPDGNSFVVNSDARRAEGEKLMFPMIPYINYSDVASSPDLAAAIALPKGSFRVDLTEEQIQAIFWGPEGKPDAAHPKQVQGALPWMLFWDGYTVHGYAIYDGEGNLFVMDLFGEYPDQSASFQLSMAPGRLPPTCLASPGLETTDVFGVPVAGWRQSYDRNGDGVTDCVCGSEFLAGDVGVRFESTNSPLAVDSGSGSDPMAAA